MPETSCAHARLVHTITAMTHRPAITDADRITVLRSYRRERERTRAAPEFVLIGLRDMYSRLVAICVMDGMVDMAAVFARKFAAASDYADRARQQFDAAHARAVSRHGA